MAFQLALQVSKLSTDELKELCNSSSDDKYNELVNQSDTVSIPYQVQFQIMLTFIQSQIQRSPNQTPPTSNDTTTRLG